MSPLCVSSRGQGKVGRVVCDIPVFSGICFEKGDCIGWYMYLHTSFDKLSQGGLMSFG